MLLPDTHRLPRPGSASALSTVKRDQPDSLRQALDCDWFDFVVLETARLRILCASLRFSAFYQDACSVEQDDPLCGR